MSEGEGYDTICPECQAVCEECDCEDPGWMHAAAIEDFYCGSDYPGRSGP